MFQSSARQRFFFRFNASPQPPIPEPGGIGSWPGGRRGVGVGVLAPHVFLVGPAQVGWRVQLPQHASPGPTQSVTAR